MKGLNKVYTFNPYNETWTEQPDMRDGRWYPTGVRMADGRILITEGLDSSGAGNSHNNDVELFTPSADMNGRGTISLIGDARQRRGAADGGLLPPHVRHAQRPRARVRTLSRRSWFLNEPRQSASTGATRPTYPAPGLGHGRAPARRQRWLHQDHAAGRPKPPAITSAVTDLAVPTTEVFDEANAGRGLAGRAAR